MARRSVTPLLWILFSAGGMVAALLFPALIVIFGVAVPLGWIPAPDYAHLVALFRHPLSRIVLLFVVTLAFFHWAHRFRYTLYDGLQIKHLNPLIYIACYGVASIGSAAAAVLLLRLGA